MCVSSHLTKSLRITNVSSLLFYLTCVKTSRTQSEALQDWLGVSELRRMNAFMGLMSPRPQEQGKLADLQTSSNHSSPCFFPLVHSHF